MGEGGKVAAFAAGRAKGRLIVCSNFFVEPGIDSGNISDDICINGITRLRLRLRRGKPRFIFLFRFYIGEGIKFAAVNARAFEGGHIPGIGAFEVCGPEGPVAALGGPDWIDGTMFLAIFFFEEDAIVGIAVFDDSFFKADAFKEAASEVIDGHFEMLRNKLNFLIDYPDVAFGWSGTASAAFETFEMQTRGIPGIF